MAATSMVTSVHIGNVIIHTNLIGRDASVYVIVNALTTTA